MSAFNQIVLNSHNRIGTYTTRYTLGSSKDGSGTNASSTGPWTYSAPESDPTKPHLDTWHRERPPSNSGGDVTDGVDVKLTRIYVSQNSEGSDGPSFTSYYFRRTAYFDSLGYLVYIGPEEIDSMETASGSGSDGGGGV